MTGNIQNFDGKIKTGEDLQNQLKKINIPEIEIIRVSIISSEQDKRLDQVINKKQDYYKIEGRIKGLNQFVGTFYSFFLYIDTRFENLPIILMKSPNMRHILVKLGTGKFYLPSISKQQWKGYSSGLTKSIVYILNEFSSYFNKSYSKSIETLMNSKIYPVNLYLWSLYKDNSSNYLQEIQKNKKIE